MDILLCLPNEFVDQHRAKVFAFSRADGDRVGSDLLVPNDEHIRYLRKLGFAYLQAELFAANVRRDTQARSSEPLLKPQRMRLESGDVVVWGGPARLAFHGVDPLRDGEHPLTRRCRYNLTFRRAR